MLHFVFCCTTYSVYNMIINGNNCVERIDTVFHFVCCCTICSSHEYVNMHMSSLPGATSDWFRFDLIDKFAALTEISESIQGEGTGDATDAGDSDNALILENLHNLHNIGNLQDDAADDDSSSESEEDVEDSDSTYSFFFANFALFLRNFAIFSPFIRYYRNRYKF